MNIEKKKNVSTLKVFFSFYFFILKTVAKSFYRNGV